MMLLVLSAIAAVAAVAAAAYCAYRYGVTRGRGIGYAQGHEHALESASRAIEDGVFRLAAKVVEDCGGRHSPTLHRFLAAFARGEHLR